MMLVELRLATRSLNHSAVIATRLSERKGLSIGPENKAYGASSPLCRRATKLR